MGLLDYRANTYSQNGEDGVLAEIIARLGLDDGAPRWCVEFGAWDGKHLSNTFLLVEQHGWNAVYIEGDPEKYQDLLVSVEENPQIIPIEAMVGRFESDPKSLDKLLAPTPLPFDYDFLSVDIDSYDLDVWESHTKYRPKIVCIEVNSNMPPGKLHRHNDVTAGNSFSSTVAVGKKKGYTPVCHTGNIIFVENSLVGQLGLPREELDNPNALFDMEWIKTKPDKMADAVHALAGRLPEGLKAPLRRLTNRGH